MEFTLGFQNELVKEIFINKLNYEDINDVKQDFKTQSIYQNKEKLDEFGQSYCYLIADESDPFNGKHMLFTDEGSITVTGKEAYGTGKYLNQCEELDIEELIDYIYQEIEILTCDVMIATLM